MINKYNFALLLVLKYPQNSIKIIHYKKGDTLLVYYTIEIIKIIVKTRKILVN